MNEEERQMHLRAGREYGQEATCGTKIRYGNEENAAKAAVAMSTKYGRDLEAYPCDFCSDWHIGRTMTEEERVRFS